MSNLMSYFVINGIVGLMCLIGVVFLYIVATNKRNHDFFKIINLIGTLFALCTFDHLYKSFNHNSLYVIEISMILVSIGCIKEYHKLLPMIIACPKQEDIKEKEEKIEYQNELLDENFQVVEHIFNSSPVGKAVVNLEGKWIKVNEALCTITGYSEEELLNTTFQSITYPEDLLEDIEKVNKLLNREIQYYELEKRYIRKDGSLIDVLLSAFLVWNLENTMPKYFVAQIQDISERKAIQKTRENVINELQRINADKDDFLNTVSHELRTPLTNMKMAISMLKVYTSSDDIEKCKKYISILEVECKREIELINDLLDLQRLESGYKEELILEKIDIKEWLEEILLTFEDRINQGKLRLEYKLERIGLVKVSLVGLSRVVTELLNNACKYTEEEGNIYLSLEEEEEYIRILIKNTGYLSDENKQKIFNKFYRIPSGKDKPKIGGTGLGLTLVKKLIENMNGSLAVECEEGYIEFTLLIPKFTNV